jgi:hypothetical protein
MKIIEIIEKAQIQPWIYIDTGFRQGKEVVLKQIRQNLDQEDRYPIDREATIEQMLFAMQSSINDLIQHAVPYELPEDYLFFLEHYGGLAIDGVDCNFSIYGIGPMAETWYGYTNSEDNVLIESGKLGWQSIGQTVFQTSHTHRYQRTLFYLDLSDAVQKNSVIGIGPWNGVDPQEHSILNNIRDYQKMWRIIAPSFTDWLGQAIETRGDFMYK